MQRGRTWCPKAFQIYVKYVNAKPYEHKHIRRLGIHISLPVLMTIYDRMRVGLLWFDPFAHIVFVLVVITSTIFFSIFSYTYSRFVMIETWLSRNEAIFIYFSKNYFQLRCTSRSVFEYWIKKKVPPKKEDRTSLLNCLIF